jgi:OmpA-OmpF porin, OOP family
MRWLALAMMSAITSVPLGAVAAEIPLTIEDMVQKLVVPAKNRSLVAAARNLTPALDLTVNFDFDSAHLHEGSRGVLNNLASALVDPRLMNLRFLVEGHTDARGTASYNDQLSGRRAEAVVAFLVEAGVARERLESVGKGFRELLDPTAPMSAVNRRVRISTLQ